MAVYTYIINIKFSNSQVRFNSLRVDAPYSHGGARLDKFEILPGNIRITAIRTTRMKDDVVSFTRCSLSKQVFKALLYYYAMSENFSIVSNVSLRVSSLQGKIYDYSCVNPFMQPISSGRNLLMFGHENLNLLFNEDETAEIYRAALSNALAANASTDVFRSFEHLWKAFNRLYTYHSRNMDDKSEKSCQKEIRKFIITNDKLFSDAVHVVSSLTIDDLRSFRWRMFVLNEYNTRSKVKEYLFWLKNYSDQRIITLCEQMIPYREKWLRDESLLNDVNDYIENIEKKTVDIEIVVLMAIKYCYFIRNKMIHGELPDRSFSLYPTVDDVNLKWLNKLLISVLQVLFCNIDKL